MNKKQTIYVKGIVTFTKNEKQPDFVLGNGVITINQLIEFCNGEAAEYMTEYKGEPQLRVQFIMGKDGKVKITVDTYRKDGGNE